MRPPWAVVDTNVVVSGLLTRSPTSPTSPTARVLDSMLEGRLSFLMSVPLLAEYGAVLVRPRLSALHGLEEKAIDRILEALARNGALRQPLSIDPVPGDLGDQHLWELLASEPGAVLVTGDQELLSSPPAWASVLSPAAWIGEWPSAEA